MKEKKITNLFTHLIKPACSSRSIQKKVSTEDETFTLNFI